MKKIIVTCICAMIATTSIFSQEPQPFVSRDSVAVSNDSIAVAPDTIGNQNREILGDKPEVNTSGDTTRIRLGKKGIVIVEKDGKTTVQIDKKEDDSEDKEFYGDHKDKEWKDDDFDDWDFKKKKKSDKFKPHFAGLELNLNNFLSSSNSMSLPKEASFMELNTSRSIGVRLNFIEYGIPLTKNMGFVTGLGFEFNSYYFASDSNNIKKENGYIVPKVKPAGSSPYEKNKLKDTYLNIPLLYEIQFPIGHSGKPLYFSFGVIGGIKIGSSTKEYYNISGEGDKKIKIKDDFYLAPFRYGFQAKVGYRMIHLVGTYFMSPLFQENKGPKLYPFDIGLVVLNF